MRTSSASHRSWQYSFDDGAQARLATMANSARSIENSNLRLSSSSPMSSGSPTSRPQVFQNIDVAVGPGVDHAQRGIVGDEFLGRATLEDAAGQTAQPFGGFGVVATSAVMDDANARAFLDGVPDVLGDLQVAQHGAVGALLVGLAQVHVSNSTRTVA